MKDHRMKTVGYIGVGNMGGALARRLLLKRSIHVTDLDDAAVERHVKLGGVAAANPAELATKCEIILMCLPTSTEVRQVIFGPGGVLETARPGLLLVDQTTGDPMATRKMAAELKDKNIDLIDAPVSGGQPGAEAGTIAIMVGGSDDQFRRIEPVLRDISSVIFHAGQIGNGQVAKIVNNAISSGLRALTFECLGLGVKAGLDPKIAVDIIAKGSGSNTVVVKHFPNHLFTTDNFEIHFALGLSHKDVSLATQLASDLQYPLGVTPIVREQLMRAINRSGRNADVMRQLHMYEELAGKRIGAGIEPPRG
jgi:3-hydroxyisobutyrate dehydrogenase